MELTIRSLQGSYIVSGLQDNATVADVKQLLHKQHSQQVPEPEEQRLVYKHSVLTASDAALQHLGITHGDQLVMLTTRPIIKRPRAQTTPAADTAAIRAAITEEARSQGIEHTLKEERPPVARRGLRLPADLLGGGNEQLLQLLQQALDGGLQLNVGGGGGQGDQAAAAGAAAEEEEEAEVQVPEPPAERITQLTEMGFSDALARNALLLQRGNVEAALEWLLEHGDDPAAAEPIPQERLRQIYSRRRGRAVGRVSLAGLRPEVVLTEMGFDAAAAQSVLAEVGPSLEMAVQLLLGGSAGGAAAAAAARASAGGAGDAGARQHQASRNQSPLPAAGAAAAAAGEDGSAAPTSPQAEESFASAAEVAAGSGEADDDAAESADEYEEEDEEEDEFEEGDEDEDEYFDDETGLYDLPIGGNLQLANFGSADMEQLLQGANLQELTLGNQLLMPGGMDTAMAGSQSTLLRLLDSPAFLEQVAAGMQALQSGEEQQQQQQQPGGVQQQQQQPDQQQSDGGSSSS